LVSSSAEAVLSRHLLAADLIGETDLLRVADAKKRHGGCLDTLILELGLLEEKKLEAALTEAFGCEELAEAPNPNPAPEVADRIPKRVAEAVRLIPQYRDDAGLHVLCASDVDSSLLDDISGLVGEALVPHVIPEARLVELLAQRHDTSVPERFAALLAHLEGDAPNPGLPAPEASDADAPPDEAWTLSLALKALRSQEDRDGIVDVGIRFARQTLPFAAFFGVRDGKLLAWKRGGDFTGAAFDGPAFDIPADSIVEQISRSPSPFVGRPPLTDGNSAFFGWLGRRRPRTAVLIPVSIKSRVVAMLAADGGSRSMELDALSELVVFGGRLGAAFEALLRAKKRDASGAEERAAMPVAATSPTPEPAPANAARSPGVPTTSPSPFATAGAEGLGKKKASPLFSRRPRSQREKTELMPKPALGEAFRVIEPASVNVERAEPRSAVGDSQAPSDESLEIEATETLAAESAPLPNPRSWRRLGSDTARTLSEEELEEHPPVVVGAAVSAPGPISIRPSASPEALYSDHTDYGVQDEDEEEDDDGGMEAQGASDTLEFQRDALGSVQTPVDQLGTTDLSNGVSAQASGDAADESGPKKRHSTQPFGMAAQTPDATGEDSGWEEDAERRPGRGGTIPFFKMPRFPREAKADETSAAGESKTPSHDDEEDVVFDLNFLGDRNVNAFAFVKEQPSTEKKEAQPVPDNEAVNQGMLGYQHFDVEDEDEDEGEGAGPADAAVAQSAVQEEFLDERSSTLEVTPLPGSSSSEAADEVPVILGNDLSQTPFQGETEIQYAAAQPAREQDSGGFHGETEIQYPDAPTRQMSQPNPGPAGVSDFDHALFAESQPPTPAGRAPEPIPLVAKKVPLEKPEDPNTALVEQLHSLNNKKVHAAQEALIKAGKKAAAAIAGDFPGRIAQHPFFDDPAPASCREFGPLLELLVKMGKRGVDLVIPFLESREAIDRHAACMVFAEVKDGRALDLLPARLHDQNPHVRGVAARGLSQFVAHRDFERILTPLRRRLYAPSADVQARAITFLGFFRDVGAVPTLIDLLADAESSGRNKETIESLRLITLQDFGSDSRAWKRWWKKGQRHTRIDWLIAGLKAKDKVLRVVASVELSKMAGEDFGFEPEGKARDRAKAVKAYESWWKQEKRQHQGL
jgi:hypothetical protein